MSKKGKNIEIEDLKITSSPKFLFALVSATFIVAIHFFTFINMKKELSKNTEVIQSTKQEITNQELNFTSEVASLKSIIDRIEDRIDDRLEIASLKNRLKN